MLLLFQETVHSRTELLGQLGEVIRHLGIYLGKVPQGVLAPLGKPVRSINCQACALVTTAYQHFQSWLRKHGV
jgi:hypothetical protein